MNNRRCNRWHKTKN